MLLLEIGSRSPYQGHLPMDHCRLEGASVSDNELWEVIRAEAERELAGLS